MTKKPGTTTKAPRKPKTSSTAPKGNPRAKPGNNLADLTPDEVRHLFLKDRGEYIAAVAKVKAAERARDEIVTQAKSDGFTKKELDLSIALADLKKEKQVIADVETRLRVARWIGHKMGAQMDMFSEPDRTPSVDRAFDEGKQASMEGKPRKSPYAETLPQNTSWFAGFDKDQERLQGQVGRGAEDKPAADTDGPQTAPHSGMGMSRRDYQAEQTRLRAEREEREAKESAAGGTADAADGNPAPRVH